jgi:hypothetical protein
VRAIPYDKRSRPTMGYVGSLVGVTREVDKSILHRVDYIRIKITTREVDKIPEVVDNAILTYLYDFHFEREMEMCRCFLHRQEQGSQDCVFRSEMVL